MNQILRGRGWGYLLVLSLAVLLIFSPLIYSETHVKSSAVTNDYVAIIQFAQQLKHGISDVPGFALAHPAWEILVIAVNALFGFSLQRAAFLVTISSIVAAAIILYLWIEPILIARGFSRWWGVALAIGLSLVTPLSLLAPLDHKYYLGYIGAISYHNPTIILLRPFAILQFIFAVKCFQEAASSWEQTLAAGAITLLATFIKPSFAICLLPAMGLVAAYRLFKKQTLNWRMFLFGFVIPSVVILAWQFLVTYGSPAGSGIFFYPFGVMSAYSGSLLIKLLLSILYPLVVAGLYFRETARDMRMVLAWLSFLLSALYTYFLAEGPPRTLDGNFTWSSEIALLVLFSVSTLFVLEQIQAGKLKAAIPGLVWVAHVASGAVYYWHVLITHKYV